MPLILLFIQYSFSAQHVSAINMTIFRSLRFTGCYFMGGIWFGVCWRSVSVWLWRCGVFMQSEAFNYKISGIKLVFFSLRNYKDDARSHKHKKIPFCVVSLSVFGRRNYQAEGKQRVTHAAVVISGLDEESKQIPPLDTSPIHYARPPAPVESSLTKA